MVLLEILVLLIIEIIKRILPLKVFTKVVIKHLKPEQILNIG